MSKDFEISRLCDAYGSLLTEHRREILRDFYDYDLSLAEIAENRGITRQAALYTIRQAENQLKDYESKMGLIEKADRLSEQLDELSRELDDDISKAKTTVERIICELPY